MSIPDSVSILSAFLDGAALAPRQSHKLLTIWPLVGAPPSSLPYATLRDAILRDEISVGEVPGGATVPHVEVENRGDAAVLVLFGEELRGALQNRIANASFLIPPHGRVVIDVSCVEQGRWERRADARFRSRGDVLSSAMRRRVARAVRESTRAGRGFRADQLEVWDEVAARLVHARAASPSCAYSDYADSRAADLAEAAAAFAAVPGQCGFVAAIGDEVRGVEAIGRPEVFARAFDGLLRSYLIDAVDAALLAGREAGDAPAPRFDGPEAFLAAVAGAAAASRGSLGLGEDLRIEGGGVSGCALVAGELVHLTGFVA